MLSLIIAAVVAFLSGYGCNALWPDHSVWSSLAGVAGFFVTMLVINLLIRKKLQAAFGMVQQAIMADQEVLQRKAKMMMGHAGPNSQRQLEEEQRGSIRRAIKMLDALQPFEKWNFMVRKQEDTLKAQFYFQLKEFDKADFYLKGSLLFDPMLVAMQMVRFYQKKDEKALYRCYLKGIHRFKDEKSAILYALYSWILVQQNKIDDAIQVLVEANKKFPNQILKQNWEALVNKKVSRFSNAGFGDLWYALYLEQPRMQRVYQQQGGYRY